MELKNVNIKSLLISYQTKNGNKTFIEKQTNKLFINLKKSIKIQPNSILIESVNNLRLPIGVRKNKIKTLTHIQQLKEVYKMLLLNGQISDQLLNNCYTKSDEMLKKEQDYYNQAVIIEFSK